MANSIKDSCGQTMRENFSNLLTTSKRRPKKAESDRVADFSNSVFENFLKLTKKQHFSRFTDKNLSVVKKVVRPNSKLLKRPVSDKGNTS